MAAAAISHPLHFFPSFILKPKHQISSNSRESHPLISPLKFVGPRLPTTANSSHPYQLCPTPLGSTRWKLSAIRGTLFLLDTSPVEENAQDIVSAIDGDGGGSSSSIVATLIFVAFIGLSVLTIGVIYIAVTDFLQKREREKFEKEQAAKVKNSGQKGKIRTRARAGPRGFGQKIEEEETGGSVTK